MPPAPIPPSRPTLRKVLATFLVSLLLLTLLAYLTDLCIFRYRLAKNKTPFGQVMVTSYDAVAQKNGKTQYIFDPPQAQSCSNSIFPHAGVPPCWYLQRHSDQRTDI
jgi:hypothetical protein